MKIDDATFEAEIHKPWPVPGAAVDLASPGDASNSDDEEDALFAAVDRTLGAIAWIASVAIALILICASLAYVLSDMLKPVGAP